MNGDTRATFAKARRWLMDECLSCTEVFASNKSISVKKAAQRKLSEVYAAIRAIDLAKNKLTPRAPRSQIVKSAAGKPAQSNNEI